MGFPPQFYWDIITEPGPSAQLAASQTFAMEQASSWHLLQCREGFSLGHLLQAAVFSKDGVCASVMPGGFEEPKASEWVFGSWCAQTHAE